MHLRRALLLFAIVLALAALAASLSRPVERRQGTAARDAPAPALAAPKPVRELRFTTATGKGRRHRLRRGERAVVEVRSKRPGQVELTGLGLSGSATELTPARFDLLPDRAGCVEVRFTPAGTIDARVVGALEITSPGSARSGERSARTTGRDRGRRGARGSAAGRYRCSP